MPHHLCPTSFASLSRSDQQALQTYDRYLQRKNTPQTRATKWQQLQRFFHSLPPPRLAELTPHHIDAFIQHAQSRGLTPGTINGYLCTLYDCFRFLQEADYLPTNPVKPRRHYLPVPLRLPRPMARDDVRKLLAATDSSRDRAIFLVALCCGLRVSEVTHLKLADLDWERHTLRVNQGKARVDRIVYLTAQVEASLRDWLTESRPQLNQPMHRSQVHRRLKRALARAGIDPHKYSFHTLRHTFATELLNAGISLRSLQELLGHKSLQEVLIYAQLYESTKRQEFYRAMAALEPLAVGR